VKQLRQWVLEWLQRTGHLEGARSCAGCHELIADDFEHDFCVTPPDLYPEQAFTLCPIWTVYEKRRVYRCWRGR
jgi:hypothetical protein